VNLELAFFFFSNIRNFVNKTGKFFAKIGELG